ncbi:MAG: SDR family NAD(P)-dependent oxidoreductase [Pseudomonadota bacterium]
MTKPVALIVGVGDGLSASVARLLHSEGYALVLSARNVGKLNALAADTDAQVVECDSSDQSAVKSLFEQVRGRLAVMVYNPSARVRGPLTDLDPEAVRNAIEVTAFGAFLAGQEAARIMLQQEIEDGKRGTILFTGASAGVKGFPQSAPFAMGKFAQRGLSESMARELHPKGIHVAWINIDGGIRNASRPERVDAANNPDSMLDPDEISKTYLHLIDQNRSVWTNEVAVRPWVEKF